MPIFSRLVFRAVRWASRRGLREEGSFSSDAKKLEARRTGIRGETYAYWYLRRQGYIFVARNFTPRGFKGEIDLVGYDGKTLAFVEVGTRTIREDFAGAAGTECYQGKTARGGSDGAAISGGAAHRRLSLPVRCYGH
jgi:hypothetical protein